MDFDRSDNLEPVPARDARAILRAWVQTPPVLHDKGLDKLIDALGLDAARDEMDRAENLAAFPVLADDAPDFDLLLLLDDEEGDDDAADWHRFPYECRN